MLYFLLNITWLVLGGFIAALLWFGAGVLCILTVVGLPWARACFMLGAYTFWPFGQQLVDRRDYYGYDDIGTSSVGMVGNILWFVFAGVWIAIAHLTAAVALALTIIGIPFAIAHVKLAEACLFPIGKAVVPSDELAVVGRRAQFPYLGPRQPTA